MAERITPMAKDSNRWYQDVVQVAELADHSPVKGSMIIRPYGYAIWERIQLELDKKIKEVLGAKNAYFPLFIPESFIKKEAKHVEGFSPELAVVTHAGGEELAEKLVVRPTSETIINEAFSRWISSYRDLPYKINQWANVVRWELRTRLFLRTSEFLWQEGHTAHAEEPEAVAMAQQALAVYTDLFGELLAMPVFAGIKSDDERFAGAEITYTCEALLKDGKALQAATSHYLGQNFAKAFDIQYLDASNQKKFVHQTSWGLSTRVIGGLVLAHGDDKGLVLPPNIAPVQVVIIPIHKTDDEKKSVLEVARTVLANLSGFRVELDDREGQSFGYKSTEWEIKGVPLRIEIGPKDLANKQVMGVHRHSGVKEPIKLSDVKGHVAKELPEFQKEIFARALKFRENNTRTAKDEKEAIEFLKNEIGYVKLAWSGDLEQNERIKKATTATNRVVLEEDGKQVAYYAKAY